MVNFGFETEGIEVVKAFPDQVKDKIFVITGPSEGGIGAETAVSLAHGSPAVLVLLGRTLPKSQSVIDAIKDISPSTLVKFVPVDLASQASVRAAAAVILDSPEIPVIHALINNAGVMFTPFSTTVDGFELQFAANHLGHFTLTNLLLPKLLAAASASAQARVVNVASSGNKMGAVRWADPSFRVPGAYDPISAYGQAKTASILATVALDAHLAASPKPGAAHLRAYALHPGSVSSGLQQFLTAEMVDDAVRRVYGSPEAAARHRIGLKTLQQGCATQLRAALDPALTREEGVFLDDCRLVTPETSAILAPYAVDPVDAERLWTMSEEMVGEEFVV